MSVYFFPVFIFLAGDVYLKGEKTAQMVADTLLGEMKYVLKGWPQREKGLCYCIL